MEPVFGGPVSNPTDEHPPSRLPNAAIMGICTVAFLLVLFITLAVVICTRKEKVKEIDLAQPLILSEEAGKKKKKKKGKTDTKAEELEEVELLQPASSSMVTELPPRAISTPPTLGSDTTNGTPPVTDEESEEIEEESSSDESKVSDSDIYGSAQQ